MTAQTLVPGTAEADLQAARLERDGKTVSQIAARFDPIQSDGAVKASIARGRHLLNQQAPKPTPVVRSVPQASPSASADASDRVEQLLTWAETDGPQRAAGLAVRVRRQLAELTALRQQHSETTRQRELVAALEKSLADAKAALRRMTASKPSAAASQGAPSAQPGSKEERALIRAWAREHGFELGDRGVIAAPIVEAYRAAHAGSAGES